MPVDQSLVGRELPPRDPYLVTAEAVADFVRATGGDPGTAAAGRVPATFPIVVAFDAVQAFLDAERLDLSRIVHGEQRFAYERPLRLGDELVARLRVTSLRSIGGNDVIGTTSALTDADGALVCTATATLVHRGGEA